MGSMSLTIKKRNCKQTVAMDNKFDVSSRVHAIPVTCCLQVLRVRCGAIFRSILRATEAQPQPFAPMHISPNVES